MFYITLIWRWLAESTKFHCSFRQIKQQNLGGYIMLKKLISVCTVACMMTSVLTFNVFAQNNSQNLSSIISPIEIKQGQLIIKFKDKESLTASINFIKMNQGKIISSQNNILLVEVDKDKLNEKIRLFSMIKGVEYVTPNYIRKAL